MTGFCSGTRTLFCYPNDRFSIPLCRTGMQGDFTLPIQSKSDTFSTSKLLSVSEDVQLLCHGSGSSNALIPDVVLVHKAMASKEDKKIAAGKKKREKKRLEMESTAITEHGGIPAISYFWCSKNVTF